MEAAFCIEEEIREQDPLKQGLKQKGQSLHWMDPDPEELNIREQDPLKQGLKHSILLPGVWQAISYSRARSIKTRIETELPDWLTSLIYIREQDPLKQGLKLTIR